MEGKLKLLNYEYCTFFFSSASALTLCGSVVSFVLIVVHVWEMIKRQKYPAMNSITTRASSFRQVDEFVPFFSNLTRFLNWFGFLKKVTVVVHLTVSEFCANC